MINNPVNLFRDPEFLALNPGVAWPGGAPGQPPAAPRRPLGHHARAHPLDRRPTRTPAAFINGKPDPWGMTVNTNYKTLALPFVELPAARPRCMSDDATRPSRSIDALARQLSIAQFPGALVTDEGGVNVTTKPPRQNPGRREVIGIIDAASRGAVPAADGLAARTPAARSCSPRRRR